MSEPINLNVARFNRTDNAADCTPRSALEATLAELENLAPDHIIIALGKRTGDNTSGTHYFQAGTYSYHAMIELLEEVKLMIRESCE